MIRQFLKDLRPVKFKLVNETTFWDTYQVQEYVEDAFDIVIDIGACQGDFTILCRHLFPAAQIYSYEANPYMFEQLKKNTAHLSNVFINNIALGDGTPLRFRLKDEETTVDPNGKVEVVSSTLKTMIETQRIDLKKRILFKCDTEGSEFYFINDEHAEIIKAMKHIGLETHFANTRGKFISHLASTNDFHAQDKWLRTTLVGRNIYYKGSGFHGFGLYVVR